MAEREEITQLLSRWREGDGAAFERLFPLMYRELRQLAQSYLSQEKAGHTLQGTALVHEAYLRLLGQSEVDWRDRGHFFAVAAQAMRRILVDHARRQKAAKRGFGEKIVLEEGLAAGETGPDFEALDEALTRLSAVDERRARVVELRFFGGMTEGEMARHLEVSPATVRRDWALARAWLYRELSEEARG
jgi:RNA polymerase sigma factor (TIGR02999 family)